MWISEKDLNTKFFHLSIKAKRLLNRNEVIKDENDLRCSAGDKIERVVV